MGSNYNIYHYVNKLHTAFVARAYELGGIRDTSSISNTAGILNHLLQSESEIGHAYLFRPHPTSWQKHYANLALGESTEFIYQDNISSQGKVCFESAIVPGASLYLADGLASSMLFRELAARRGIRVPEVERNLITIFKRKLGNRNIVNLQELRGVLQAQSRIHDKKIQVQVVEWDHDTPFQVQ